jgi:SAM-dependent methyltransferase
VTSVFGAEYADLYDELYADKDYEGEVEQLVRIFDRWARGSVRTVLDLGCGTGGHAIPLARRGFRVTGVDRSEEMLRAADKHAALAGVSKRVQLLRGDVRSEPLDGTFDAALLMFAVLGYQLRNQDVLATLRSARSRLRQGGLLVLDAWSGIAVLREGPSSRSKIIRRGERSVRREASASLYPSRHACAVLYTLSRNDEPSVPVTEERHLMRYFFPLELELFLDVAGFELLRLGTFPNIDDDLDDKQWNLMAVARARESAGLESVEEHRGAT